MNTIKVICEACAGIGKEYKWKTICMNDAGGTMEREEIVCEACNGKGYTEYAVFNLEEAKAILKHCGLSTES